LRFGGGFHPAWLGYKDRHLFPSHEPDPSFYFIRKFNLFGTKLQEPKLIEYIKTELFVDKEPEKCTIELMSVRKECMNEMLREHLKTSEVVMVPVNLPFLNTAKNLECSLQKLGYNDVIYWALDLDAYEYYLDLGKLVIFLPGLDPLSSVNPPKTQFLKEILRWKPKAIKMVVESGIDCWFLDADVIALKPFQKIKDSADVFFGMKDYGLPSGGIMFFRSTENSIKILDFYQNEMVLSSQLDDEDALARLVKKQNLVYVLNPSEDLYKPSVNSAGVPAIRLLSSELFLSTGVYDRSKDKPKLIQGALLFHHKVKKGVNVLNDINLLFLNTEMKCDIFHR
jgi:hypothetical protein